MESCETVTVADGGQPAMTVLCDRGGEVDVGDTTTHQIDVENAGDARGSYAYEIEVDGSAVDSISGELDAGERDTFTIEITFNSPGTVDVWLNAQQSGLFDVSCGSYDVSESFNPGDVTVTCLESPSEVEAGDTGQILYRVENNNPLSASYSVDVLFNGTPRDPRSGTTEGTLAAGGTETSRVTFEFPEAGSFETELDLTATQA